VYRHSHRIYTVEGVTPTTVGRGGLARLTSPNAEYRTLGLLNVAAAQGSAHSQAHFQGNPLSIFEYVIAVSEFVKLDLYIGADLRT
jgi:hypothetical protein